MRVYSKAETAHLVPNYKYPASVQALAFGEGYADYIERSTQDHVDKGHFTEEYAMRASLSECLTGNDGD